VQIKASKERLNQERKELEMEKQEVLRMKEIMSAQSTELLKQHTVKNKMENNYIARNHFTDEIVPAQVRAPTAKREENNFKFANTQQREDPLLLNLNQGNNLYFDNSQKRFGSGRDNLREDLMSGNLRAQNTNKFTETEYDNTEEEFGETERDREMFNHLEERVPMSRDFASVSSQGEKDSPQLRQLQEIFSRLDNLNAQ